jgi:hypothetical protein
MAVEVQRPDAQALASKIVSNCGFRKKSRIVVSVLQCFWLGGKAKAALR